jgi:hypothetical protein
MEISKEQVLDIYGTTGNLYLHSKLTTWFPDAFKVEFEAGNVYKLRDMIIIFKGNQEAYGFSDGIWFNNEGWELHENKSEWQEATTEEWGFALIEEAKKRGYKNGNYKCLALPSCTELVSNDFFIENQELWIGDLHRGNMIFQNGIWAEIIKTFSKEEAEELLGGRII